MLQEGRRVERLSVVKTAKAILIRSEKKIFVKRGLIGNANKLEAAYSESATVSEEVFERRNAFSSSNNRLIYGKYPITKMKSFHQRANARWLNFAPAL